jgi:hypothetical protein
VLTAFRAATKKDGLDPIYDLFSVKTTAEMKCSETEERYVEETTSLNLKCNINAEVGHLTEGIKLALIEDREKMSEQLGRVALWKGSAKLARLPAYLTVQSMRFFYKVESQQRAKIMRAVCILRFHLCLSVRSSPIPQPFPCPMLNLACSPSESGMIAGCPKGS